MACEDRELELLERAGREVRSRVEQDRDRVSADLKPALAHIAEEFLTRGFTIAGLRRATGLDHAQNQSFREQLGALPRDYCGARRLDAAVWLVRETDLVPWRIADLFGYSQSFAFTRAFQKHTGRTPTEMRESSPPAAERAVPPAREEVSWKLWVGANAAELDPKGAKRVLDWRHLQVSADELPPSPLPVLFTVDAPEEQGPMAKTLWRRVRALPLEDQRDLVAGAQFHTPAFFHLLGKKSLEKGRRNRRRGIFLARLALASLEPSREALGDAYHDLRALGWARLGNAWRLANRHREAEEAFARAARAWEVERQRVDRRVEAELLWHKSNLRRYQRRFSEAWELVNRATALCHLTGHRRLLVQCFVQQAALCIYGGDPGAALPVLREAEQVARQCPGESELMLFVLQAFAAAYTLKQDYAAAEQLFPTVLRLCGRLNRADGSSQVRWLQGLVSSGQSQLEQAVAHLQAARAGFLVLEDMDSAAMVAMDEAELHLRCGRTAEVVRLAAESIPVFEALALGRESLATLEVLREAVAKEAVTVKVIQEVRQRFAKVNPNSMLPLLVDRVTKNGPG